MPFLRFILMVFFVGATAGMGWAKDRCVIDEKNHTPDRSCTPGAVLPDVTAKDVCTPLYTAKVRNVPGSMKRRVYAAYGMDPKKKPCPCEVDHFISLELGGSNEITNLWPEPYENPLGARIKDQVENSLHRRLCHGKLTLGEAQALIQQDWVGVYREIHPDIGPSHPAPGKCVLDMSGANTIPRHSD